jgi:heme/copper-type cytochrome/quinol oxidase subunit 3
MDPIRTKKYAINALIFRIIPIVLIIFSIFLFLVFVKVQVPQTQNNEAYFIAPTATFALIGIIAIGSILLIVSLIFYILTLVETSKHDEKISFILLIVGFFVDIVGIVALIMLLMEINKLEKPNNQIEEI